MNHQRATQRRKIPGNLIFWDNHECIEKTLLCFSDVIFWRFYWTSKIIWILPCEQIRITTYLPADQSTNFISMIINKPIQTPVTVPGTKVLASAPHNNNSEAFSWQKRRLSYVFANPQSVFIPHRKQLMYGLREYFSLTLKQVLENYLFAARSGVIRVYLSF